MLRIRAHRSYLSAMGAKRARAVSGGLTSGTLRPCRVHLPRDFPGTKFQDTTSVPNTAVAKRVQIGTTIRTYLHTLETARSVWLVPLLGAGKGSVGGNLGSPGPVAQSGQSSGLIIRWLQVQILPGPQDHHQEKHPETWDDQGKASPIDTLRNPPSFGARMLHLALVLQQGCNRMERRWAASNA